MKLIVPYIKEKNPPDANMFTPLHAASRNGHLNIVEFLSQNVNNANPKASQFWNYHTPFHQAALKSHLDVVQYFVQNLTVNVNEKTQPGFFGQTAYEIAFQEEKKAPKTQTSLKILKLLGLKVKASLNLHYGLKTWGIKLEPKLCENKGK